MSEIRNGTKFGKYTIFKSHKGKKVIVNIVHGVPGLHTRVLGTKAQSPDCAFYSEDGQPRKAIADDWKTYANNL